MVTLTSKQKKMVIGCRRLYGIFLKVSANSLQSWHMLKVKFSVNGLVLKGFLIVYHKLLYNQSDYGVSVVKLDKYLVSVIS